MKIGILTYHAPCNFGANLQAYSVVKYFENRGFEACVINFIRDGEFEASYCDEKQRPAHFIFSQKKLPVTELVSERNILNVVKKNNIDVIIVGADAVWSIDKDNLKIFYLAWLWDSDISIKAVCVSPAFMGKTYQNLPERERKKFKSSLLKFSYVNTRDEWTRKKINEEIMGFEYIKKTNPDPVFLLNDMCDEKWMPQINVPSKKYVLISLPAHCNRRFKFIKKLWIKIFAKILHKNGLNLVELPIPEGVSDFKFDYTVPYPIDPLQWFLWIKNAAGFVGLRFHAVVSCISVGTPFFSFDSYGSIPRMLRILNILGFHLFDRKVNTSSKIRNLLEGSSLEHLRVNGSSFFSVSPFKIFKYLKNTDPQKILAFRDENVRLFKANMDELIDSVKR